MHSPLILILELERHLLHFQHITEVHRYLPTGTRLGTNMTVSICTFCALSLVKRRATTYGRLILAGARQPRKNETQGWNI